MGLINTEGNYVRIINVDPVKGRIGYETYKSKQIRLDGPGPFDEVLTNGMRCKTLQTHINATPSADTIKDSLWTAAYQALKDEPPFNNTGDETWTDDI